MTADHMPRGTTKDQTDPEPDCTLHGGMHLESSFELDGDDVEIWRCSRSTCNNYARVINGEIER